MMQLRGGHRLQAAQQPPMRPSIPPPPTTTGMMPSPPLTPQPVHRRRPASPFRMSQLSSPLRLPPNGSPAMMSSKQPLRPPLPQQPHLKQISASANSSPVLARRKASPSAIPSRLLLNEDSAWNSNHVAAAGSFPDLRRDMGKAT